MLRFQNDYSEGTHPNVLRALCDTNLCSTPGYGLDDDCRRAADLFARLPRRTAHKLRTNAKTGHGKYSRMHNLENHSQKGLYKCGFLWYLHISNNSCY